MTELKEKDWAKAVVHSIRERHGEDAQITFEMKEVFLRRSNPRYNELLAKLKDVQSQEIQVEMNWKNLEIIDVMLPNDIKTSFDNKAIRKTYFCEDDKGTTKSWLEEDIKDAVGTKAFAKLRIGNIIVDEDGNHWPIVDIFEDYR